MERASTNSMRQEAGESGEIARRAGSLDREGTCIREQSGAYDAADVEKKYNQPASNICAMRARDTATCEAAL